MDCINNYCEALVPVGCSVFYLFLCITLEQNKMTKKKRNSFHPPMKIAFVLAVVVIGFNYTQSYCYFSLEYGL